VGGYGFLRFVLPILPDASHYLAGFVITLSLIAVIYIGFVALVQPDMKKLIACLVDRPHGIRHAGHVPLQRARRRGRYRADDLTTDSSPRRCSSAWASLLIVCTAG
jgi:hypothetical protein